MNDLAERQDEDYPDFKDSPYYEDENTEYEEEA